MTHGQIGARLVKHWQLPREIAEVVGLHHSQDLGSLALSNPLIRLVGVAEKLLPDFGIAEHTFDPIEKSEWRDLCIDESREKYVCDLANELAFQVVQLPDAQMEEQPVVQNNEEVLPSQDIAGRRITERAAPPELPAANGGVAKHATANIYNPVRWLFRLLGKLFR